MTQKRNFSYAVLAASILLFAGVFSSNTDAVEKNPCNKDFAKFCKNVSPENDGILKCLEEHANELSKECRDYEGVLEVNGEDGKVLRAKTRKTKFPYVYR